MKLWETYDKMNKIMPKRSEKESKPKEALPEKLLKKFLWMEKYIKSSLLRGSKLDLD